MRGPMNARILRRSRRRHAALGRARGFTLIEVMIVVVIIGVMATLATFGVRRYIRSAKTAEAVQIIGSIKAGQEAYFDETFRYADISGGDLDDAYPDVSDLSVKVQWDPGSDKGKLFASIGVYPAAAVQYRYSTIAGPPSASAPDYGDGGVTATEYPFTPPAAPWYVVKALGDLDGNSGGTCGAHKCGVYLSTSTTNEIFAYNSDE